MTTQPAIPVLASTLYASSQSGHKRRRLISGHYGLDEDALCGGLAYGKDALVCVSANGELGGEIALAFLSRHLIDHADAPAYYIDTVGGFSPLRLKDSLAASIQKATLQPDPAQNINHVTPVEATAEAMMGRVSVMRVFDFVGVTEAVGEVRESLEGKTGAATEHADSEQHLERHDMDLERDESEKPLEIADSDEEAGDLDLDVLNSPIRKTAAPPPNPQNDEVARDEGAERPASHPDTAAATTPETPPALIILNNLPRIISPLMKSNHIAAHALLSNLLRSLRHLTTSHSACALLLNTTVGSTGTSTSPSRSTESDLHADYARVPGPSIFGGFGDVRPALGRTMPFLLDVHLFVTSLPKEDGARADVVEVLGDRFGGRVGRWGVF